MEDVKPPAHDPNRMKIRKFDPKRIKQDRIIFLVGKRGSGKSVLEEETPPVRTSVHPRQASRMVATIVARRGTSGRFRAATAQMTNARLSVGMR